MASMGGRVYFSLKGNLFGARGRVTGACVFFFQHASLHVGLYVPHGDRPGPMGFSMI